MEKIGTSRRKAGLGDLLLLAATLLMVMGTASALPAQTVEKPAWDDYSDTWVATDALGRHLVTSQQAGAPRADRFVGIFYLLWQGAHVNGGPFDISRILRIDPEAMQHADSPLWGPLGAPHHWGEPLFGYYIYDDQWVLRQHARMLADAGVDVLICDNTNKITYKKSYTALFEALRAVRQAGNKTPQVAFLMPFWDPKTTVQELYDELYSKGLYKELWFQWEGKPLILADPAKVNPALLSFFTFRNCQPSYFEGPTGPNMWSWLEVYPQHVFRNDRGEKEQMSVGVAQNGVGNRLGSMSEPGARGRSFHKGVINTDAAAELAGYNIAEQWERALKEDPKFVFITGWNEWWASRFDEFNKIKMPVMFVDQFDQEHSRDIEPMKGGHGDNYYYQMVDYIRRFKGARSGPVASGEKTIDVKGDFSQWADVLPEYRDNIGDTFHREHPGYNTATRYVNTTGRNDFVVTKVAGDPGFIYFYVRTREPITAFSDPNWMMLFLNVDRDQGTGWQGYDFVVNHRVKDQDTTFLEYTKNGWNWVPRAEVKYRVQANELMLAIPRQALAIVPGSDLQQFEFKWADNIQRDDDINEFTINGDAAPPGRFNYLYVTRIK
jgi:hypothetical protein